MATPNDSGLIFPVAGESRATIPNALSQEMRMGVVPKIPPSAYVNWYQNIDVWTTAGPVKQASVTRYLCNIAKYGGLGDSPVFWQTILQAANAAKLFYRKDQVAGATQCFWGKAAPDDVAHALRIVEDVAVNNLDYPGLKPFHGILADNDRIAKVCEKYIGVDCNGFVGNYAVENSLPGGGPNTLPNDWSNVGPVNKWRSTVAEIQPLDVLIWPDGAHIAIIDSVKNGQFAVCQSTGPGGPQTSTGHVISPATTADTTPRFKVDVGRRQDGQCPSTIPATVRIKSIGFIVTGYVW